VKAPGARRELGGTGQVVETMIPRRLDRLPWSRWNWLVVIGLGITWILDEFEVTPRRCTLTACSYCRGAR
jgi:hypothetical protein